MLYCFDFDFETLEVYYKLNFIYIFSFMLKLYKIIILVITHFDVYNGNRISSKSFSKFKRNR